MTYTADGQVVLATSTDGKSIHVTRWSRKVGPNSRGGPEGSGPAPPWPARVAAPVAAPLADWEKRSESVVEGSGYIGHVCFSADARRVVGMTNKEIVVHDLSGGPVLSLPFEGHVRPSVLAISGDGEWLAGKCNSTEVLLWNLKTGKGPYSWISAKILEHWPLAVGTDGIVAVVTYPPRGTKSTEILVVDVPRARLLHTLSQPELLNVTLSNDGRTLIAAGKQKSVKLWDMKSGDVKFTLRGSPLGTKYGFFTADGNRVFTVGDDDALRLWNIRLD
jgi:WD40 repeat protein